MNVRRTVRTIIVSSCAATAVGLASLWSGPGDQSAFAQSRRFSQSRLNEDGVEFLMRGPVHEAFAEPIVFEAEGGLFVSSEPPEVIDEIPPDQAPTNDNVQWIPGYWSWDEPRGEFLWVSGIWRVIPSGMDWVPGYWAESNGGFYWVSGFWRPIRTTEVSYLPEPPATLEEGPIGNPPSPDHVWVSGTWRWDNGRYAWQPGYYVHAQPGWIWSPAHYVWSPSGYIFVDGFWDYSIRRRGVLFAPVYFQRPVYSGFVLSPTVVIDTDIFVDHLFVHPRYGHYYFGDYYDYVGVGVYPWFDFHLNHIGYDPIFAYYDWHYSRRDPRWVTHLRQDYRYRREHHDARPFSSFAEIDRGSQRDSRQDRSLILGTSLDKFSQKDSSFKFAKLDEKRREEIKERTRSIREFSESRVKLEKEKSEKGALKTKQAVKAEMPKSPLASAAGGRESGRGKDNATPEKPKVPDVDESKERKQRGEQGRSDRERDRDQDRSRERDRSERSRAYQAPEKTQSEQPRAKDEGRDRAKTQDRPQDKARPEQPRDRTQPDRSKAEESRDRLRQDRIGAEERSRTADRPRADQSRERPGQDRTRAEERSKQDRPKADESRERPGQDRQKGDDARERVRPDRSSERDRQARPDRSQTEQGQVKSRVERPPSERGRESGRQDRPSQDSKDKRSPERDDDKRDDKREKP